MDFVEEILYYLSTGSTMKFTINRSEEAICDISTRLYNVSKRLYKCQNKEIALTGAIIGLALYQAVQMRNICELRKEVKKLKREKGV